MFHTSILLSYCCCWIISGDEYSGVPQRVSLRSGECMDQPKSHTFTISCIWWGIPHGVASFRAWDLCGWCRYRACTRWQRTPAWWYCEHAIHAACPTSSSCDRRCRHNRAPSLSRCCPHPKRTRRVGQYWDDLDSSGSLFIAPTGQWSEHHLGRSALVFSWGHIRSWKQCACSDIRFQTALPKHTSESKSPWCRAA